MTPTQHKTEAETRIAAMTTPPANSRAVSEDDADVLSIQAHAHMSKALGTGTHYSAADSLLAEYATARSAPRSTATRTRLARLAVAHAVLADR